MSKMESCLNDIEVGIRTVLNLHDDCYCDDEDDPMLDSRQLCIHCCMLEAKIALDYIKDEIENK